MMSATTGRAIDEATHIRASVRDILRTPIGTRVMRREYGSMLFALIDAPMDRVTVLDIIQATAGAIGRWEPRVRVQRAEIVDAKPGHLTLNLDLWSRATGEAIRLTDALGPDPDDIATLRTTDEEAVRLTADGRLRRVIIDETKTSAVTATTDDFGAALAHTGETSLAVTLSTSDALAGAPLASSLYYVAETEESLMLKVGDDTLLGHGTTPYDTVQLSVTDGQP